MRLQSTVIIAAALTAGSLAFAAEKPSGDEIYEIRTIGEPKSCITRSSIRSTDVIDDQTIDFEMRNGDIYRNKLPNKCGGLGFEEAFSYKTSTNRLCSVDIIPRAKGQIFDWQSGNVAAKRPSGGTRPGTRSSAG